MDRSTAILITFLMIIGIVILITAAPSCSTSNDLQPQTATATTNVDTIAMDYPYEWDTMHYNRIISYINGSATSMKYNLTVTFNEEFIQIVDNDLKSYGDENLIFVGHWTNKYTFVIDDNHGVATINLKTGYMTIRYSDYTKEIYTH